MSDKTANEQRSEDQPDNDEREYHRFLGLLRGAAGGMFPSAVSVTRGPVSVAQRSQYARQRPQQRARRQQHDGGHEGRPQRRQRGVYRDATERPRLRC